jgi:uncharacterized protein (TIGR03435 family)
MHAITKLIASALVAVSPMALAQTQPAPAPTAVSAAPLTFDIVSVKRNKTDDAHPGSMIREDGFDAENQLLSFLMCFALNCPAGNHTYLSGLPAWVGSERYDIIAKVAGPDVDAWHNLPDAGKQRMIRDVLTDRFKLRTHIETHEQPVFALTIAKGGSKLTESPAPAAGKSPPTHGWFGFSRTGIVAGNMTLSEFSAQLSTMNLGREVQDHTGLIGRYNLKLDFAPITPASAPAGDQASAPPIDARPDIFTAIQEQLGLKLEPSHGPVQTMVIDHIERPSAN